MNEEINIPEFGIKRDNEERRDGGCAVVFDPETQLYAMGKDDSDGFLRFFGGGIEEKEDKKEGVLRELVEESGLHDFSYTEQVGEVFTHFHNKLKNINRFARSVCFLVVLRSANVVDAKLEEHEKFSLAWANAKQIMDGFKSRNNNKDYDHWIYYFNRAIKRAKELGYDTTTNLEDLE